MIVKLLTEHHLEFLCFKGGCTGSFESTLIKMRIVGNHMSWLGFLYLCLSGCQETVYLFHHRLVRLVPLVIHLIS